MQCAENVDTNVVGGFSLWNTVNTNHVQGDCLYFTQ